MTYEYDMNVHCGQQDVRQLNASKTYKLLTTSKGIYIATVPNATRMEGVVWAVLWSTEPLLLKLYEENDELYKRASTSRLN